MEAPNTLAGTGSGVSCNEVKRLNKVAEVETGSLVDVFHIDDLLDFSNEDIAGPIGEGGSILQLSDLTADSTVTMAETVSCSSSLEERKEEQIPCLLDEDEHIKTDLCVPCDDLAELEWLSKFVEDSFSMGETPKMVTNCCPLTVSVEKQTAFSSNTDRFERASPISVLESSATSSELTGSDYREFSVPGRARSKRSRTGVRVWTSRILPSNSSVNSLESMATDSNIIMDAHSYSPLTSPAVSGDSGVEALEQGSDSLSSKMSWKPSKGRKKGQDVTQPWRCMHCATQRTPQWRTGPMGPKTLCNACGVRYKSGRLLPEYRPAGSPGYIGHKHSNSHKKILEMRRQRELTVMHHEYPVIQMDFLAASEKPFPSTGLENLVDDMQR